MTFEVDCIQPRLRSASISRLGFPGGGGASGPARSGRGPGASRFVTAPFVAAVPTPHPLLRLARRPLYRTMVNAPLGVFPLLEKGM
jgi:hypothetical protein